MKSAVLFGLMIIGLLLLVASSVWASLFPPTSNWTDEKARRASEVKARLNDLGPIVNGPPRMQRGPDPGTLKSEFDALVKENAQLDAEFVSASEAPKKASSVLKWTGISLTAIGVIGWYVVKNSS
jgi:hypothetical protein